MTIAILMDKKARARTLSGIDRYAASDSSDPFAAKRAYAHLRQGMIDEGDYDADVTTETRGMISVETGRHTEFKVPAYRGVKRA